MRAYIGVPTLNNLSYLRQTINSIEAQTHTDWKLLIVDNASNDERTRQWVAAQDKYESILNPENFGVAKAWNQIIYWAMSHDDFDNVFILNNDIVLHFEALERMLETIYVNGVEATSAVNIGRLPEMLLHCTKPEPRYSKALNFSCFGLTKQVITRVGVFDEGFKIAYFEDNDYHHRMMDEDIKSECDLWAWFSHYGSRTIKEAGVAPLHDQFNANREYFYSKWGFYPGSEGERLKVEAHKNVNK